MTWIIITSISLVLVAGLAIGRAAFSRPPPPPSDAHLQRLLRRLTHVQALSQHEPDICRIGLAERLSADALAYDYLLVECAGTIGVDVPERPLTRRLSAGEQLRLEVELADRGLHW